MANDKDKEELPKKGSKKFWQRGFKKLSTDVQQTANVLELLTPGGLTTKILKKGLPKLTKKGWK